MLFLSKQTEEFLMFLLYFLERLAVDGAFVSYSESSGGGARFARLHPHRRSLRSPPGRNSKKKMKKKNLTPKIFEAKKKFKKKKKIREIFFEIFFSIFQKNFP